MSAGKYRTIVADPPWPMPESGRWTGKGGNWAEYNGKTTALPYSAMPLTEIESLPVSDLLAADAHLYIWTVNRHLERTYSVARAWGCEPAVLLTWCKAPMGLGMGGAFSSTTEFILLAKRGSLRHTGKVDSSWWQWPRSEHSAKPDALLDYVEQVSPGPYLELFARRARFGWSYWGDESLGTAEMPESAA
jgi:N6-adenosine-specific RNA methylase IME4